MNEDEVALAELLREAGWTCTPPVHPGAKLPEPAVGQVWRSPNPLIQPREVIMLDKDWCGYDNVVFTTKGRGRSRLRVSGFLRWAKGAKAVPDPVVVSGVM